MGTAKNMYITKQKQKQGNTTKEHGSLHGAAADPRSRPFMWRACCWTGVPLLRGRVLDGGRDQAAVHQLGDELLRHSVRDLGEHTHTRVDA